MRPLYGILYGLVLEQDHLLRGLIPRGAISKHLRGRITGGGEVRLEVMAQAREAFRKNFNYQNWWMRLLR